MEYNATDSDSLEFAEVSVGAVCDPYALPSVAEYFTAFNLLGVGLFSLGGLAVTLTFGLYVDTIVHILRFAPPKTKTHSCFVVTVYPVVCLVTFCAMLVPRAQYIAESVCQGMFMCSMYQLFCLVVAYAGGESMLVKRLSPCDISPKVAPCCCCCLCLPAFKLTKNRLKILRALVLQLPIVQGLTYLGLLVMWAEEQTLYQVNYNYFQPVVVSSILLGIWGMVMTVKMSAPGMEEYRLQAKFLVLQLVLILSKVQGLAARAVAAGSVFPCRHPITPAVYTNLVYNSVIMWEMVLLAGFARLLYKLPVPESYQTDRNSNLPKQLCNSLQQSPDKRLAAVSDGQLPDCRNPSLASY